MRPLRLPPIVLWIVLCATPALADSLSDANEHYRAGRYDEAISKYADAQAKVADPSVVQFNLGDARYRKNRFGEAASAFERAAATRDALLEAKARYNMGNCSYRQGQLPQALESYRKAIELISGEKDLGAEGRKVLGDAQANYEFVQNKIKEEAKAAQPQPQQKQQQKQKQEQAGGQKKDQQQEKGKEEQAKQREQTDREQQAKEEQKKAEQQKQLDKKEQEKKEQEKKEQEKQAQAQAQKKEEKGKEEQKEKQEQKGEEKQQAQEAQMSKEEAARLLDAFGQFEEQKKIQDRFHANEPRPAKDW